MSVERKKQQAREDSGLSSGGCAEVLNRCRQQMQVVSCRKGTREAWAGDAREAFLALPLGETAINGGQRDVNDFAGACCEARAVQNPR